MGSRQTKGKVWPFYARLGIPSFLLLSFKLRTPATEFRTLRMGVWLSMFGIIKALKYSKSISVEKDEDESLSCILKGRNGCGVWSWWAKVCGTGMWDKDCVANFFHTRCSPCLSLFIGWIREAYGIPNGIFIDILIMLQILMDFQGTSRVNNSHKDW